MKAFLVFLALVIFTGCQMANMPNIPPAFPRSPAVDSVDDPPLFRDGVGQSVLIMGDSRGANGGTFDALPNPVYNLSVGGSTIFSVTNKLHRLNDINPKFVFIFTGINDMDYLSLDYFRIGLVYSTEYLVNTGAKVYIMDQAFLNQTNTSFGYCALMQSMRYTHYVPLLLTPADYIDAYCHFTPAGYTKVTDAISRIIALNS